MNKDLVDKINDFLRSPIDYTLGVQLLFAANKSTSIRDSLTKIPSKEKLVRYLKYQITEATIEPSESSSPEEETTPVDPNIHAEMVKLWKEFAFHHAIMSQSNKPAKRYEKMLICTEIDSKLSELQYQVDFHAAHGHYPVAAPKTKVAEMTQTEAHLILTKSRLIKSISADKALLKKLHDQLLSAKNIMDSKKINNKIENVKRRLERKENELKNVKVELS